MVSSYRSVMRACATGERGALFIFAFPIIPQRGWTAMLLSAGERLGPPLEISGRSPMVEPPFEEEHGKRNGGDRTPQFHICALQGRGGDFGVFAHLQFVSWHDVA